MAILTKANNLTALNLAGSWVENLAPTSTRQIKFDGTFTTSGASLSQTGNMDCGAMWIDTTAPASILLDTGTYSHRIFGDGSGVPDGRSIYVASNHFVGGTVRYVFLNGLNHGVYVGSGGDLKPSGQIYGSGSGAGTSSITKYGPGNMWFGVYSGSSPAGASSITGLTIAEGTIVCAGLGSTATNPIGTGNITFSPSAGASPTLQFNGTNSAARTLPNAISMSGYGTIDTPTGFTATITGAAGGGGVLTVTGGGVLNINNNITCPVTVAAGGYISNGSGASTSIPTLTVNGTFVAGGSSRTVSVTSSLLGSGTLSVSNTNTLSLTADASSYAGSYAGDFLLYTGTGAINGNFTGSITITGGEPKLTGASTGTLGTINWAYVTLRNAMTGGAGGATDMAGAGSGGTNPAKLIMDGPAAALNSSRSLTARNGALIQFLNGSSLTCAVNANSDTTNITVETLDTSSSTYSGTFTTNQASGSVFVRAATGGTLVLAGSVNGTNAGRTIALNDSVGYAGTVKVTGTGFTGPATVTLARGTLACAAVGNSYCAQFRGNLTPSAGTTFKFAA